MIGEASAVSGVYLGMRVLCVGRHEFLSEHLCRLFREFGVVCEPAVGLAAAVDLAGTFEPDLVLAECDLLSLGALESLARETALRDVPVVAVSLTRRVEECSSADFGGVAGFLYLPALTQQGALAALEAARRPRGVHVPVGATLSAARQPSAIR